MVGCGSDQRTYRPSDNAFTNEVFEHLLIERGVSYQWSSTGGYSVANEDWAEMVAIGEEASARASKRAYVPVGDRCATKMLLKHCSEVGIPCLEQEVDGEPMVVTTQFDSGTRSLRQVYASSLNDCGGSEDEQ